MNVAHVSAPSATIDKVQSSDTSRLCPLVGVPSPPPLLLLLPSIGMVGLHNDAIMKRR